MLARIACNFGVVRQKYERNIIVFFTVYVPFFFIFFNNNPRQNISTFLLFILH
jgi:hypothetical protein